MTASRRLLLACLTILVLRSPCWAVRFGGIVTKNPDSPLAAALPVGVLNRAISSQIANQIPILSTSAGYTYRWSDELETLERSAITFGPLFTERAVTIGRGRFNVNAAYSYIKFDEFNGRNLDKITNRIEKAYVPETGTVEYFGLFRPFEDLDGIPRFAGDQVRLKIDLEAQVFDFSLTYGLLDDLDVNINVPVLRTYSRTAVQERLPDPRCLDVSEDCNIALDLGGDENGFFVFPQVADRESALGLGDIHFRTKWAPITAPVRLAGLLDLIVPTGSPADAHGTGDTRLGVLLIGSRDVWRYFELHSQGGIEFNCDDVDLSQARYAAGVSAQITDFLGLTVDLIGRSEFGAQARVPNSARLPAVRDIGGVPTLVQPLDELTDNDNFRGRPVFVDIKRNDQLDLAVGTRLALGNRSMILANFSIPLNQDGLRANFVPTISFETNF